MERAAALMAAVLLMSGLIASVGARRVDGGLLLEADVPYGPDRLERSDLYGGHDLHGAPVVIFFHGGAYAFGDKNEPGGLWGNVARTMARAGFLAINADYRLSPRATWPAGAEDVGRLVAWTRTHARAFGGDPDRIVLIGHSAGATHVAGYVFDRRLQPARGPGVTGAVLVSGRYALDAVPRDANAPEVLRYFGRDRAVRAARAPMARLATAPHLPLMIVVAELEDAELAEAARSLAAELAGLGEHPWLLRLAGESHVSEMTRVGTSDRRLSDPMISFVRQVCRH